MADERFGLAAVALAGMMARALGWRPDEFWRATPAELAAVLDALAGRTGEGPAATGGDVSRLKEMFPDG